ncbi:hypothetical protein D3C73_1614150 [compost metagenome]
MQAPLLRVKYRKLPVRSEEIGRLRIVSEIITDIPGAALFIRADNQLDIGV